MLIAENQSGQPVGLIELSLRPYAEGCQSSPVAYLEGLYVVPGARRTGIARARVAAAEDWGRGQSCTERASDAASDNEIIASTHQSLGFTDAGLIRCFHKKL